MKRNVILLCVLLSICLCFTACGEHISQEPSDIQSETHIPSDTSAHESSTAQKPPLRALNVSSIPYTLPSNGYSDTGGANEDLIPYVEDAYNVIILVQIVGMDALKEYSNTYQKMTAQEEMNEPELYHKVHHFNISQETLLEASYIGNGKQYDKDILRAMYLPYEDMLAATMRPQAAYLDGNVYNIKTLNELFQEDKEAFSRINLDELVDFQERLEENGINYGFNQDMVDFANKNCRRTNIR